MSRSTTQRTVFLIDIVGAALAIALTVCGWWAIDARRHAAPPGDSVAQEIAVQQGLARDLSERIHLARAEIDHLRNLLERTAPDLPHQSQMNRRLDELTRLLAEAGLQAEQITLGEALSAGHFAFVPIRLTGTTSYGDFRRFLDSLHSRFHDLRITTMEFVPSVGQASRLDFRVDMVWCARRNSDRPAPLSMVPQPRPNGRKPDANPLVGLAVVTTAGGAGARP